MKHEASHEAFIAEVASLALGRLSPEERETCRPRIVYGSGGGMTGVRGVCYYSRWQNGEPDPVDLVEICAFGEESLVQVAGTTIHELAHALAGPDAGHRKLWKAACARLGLRCARAAGMTYSPAALAPEIRELVWFHEFSDGRPATTNSGLFGPLAVPTLVKPRPCSLGYGTQGGRSRGKGSGTRYRKFVCDCEPQVIVRSARDVLDVTCNACETQFKRG